MGEIADMLNTQGARIKAQRDTLGHGSGMTGDDMFGDTRPRPVLRDLPAPLVPNAMLAKAARECAYAIARHADPDRSRATTLEAFARALDVALRDVRDHDLAQAAREAGL